MFFKAWDIRPISQRLSSVQSCRKKKNLNLDSNSILHIKTKYILYHFTIQLIFQDCNSHMNKEKAVVCLIRNYTKSNSVLKSHIKNRTTYCI